MNRQNSPGRAPYQDVSSPRNIGELIIIKKIIWQGKKLMVKISDPRNPQTAMNLPQRPSNLILENSPRKPVLETKTDYGKYR